MSLLRGPAQDALSAVVRARMVVTLQRRLVAAVSAPAGIAQLMAAGGQYAQLYSLQARAYLDDV